MLVNIFGIQIAVIGDVRNTELIWFLMVNCSALESEYAIFVGSDYVLASK